MEDEAMIRNLVILCILIILASLYTFWSDFQSTPKAPIKTQQEIKISAPAPSFTFEDLNGKKYDLEDYKGKVIVLNFWATWCAPCVVEFPAMLKLANIQKDNSVFIFLSIDDNKEEIARFLKKHAKSLPQNAVVGHDVDKTVSQDLFQTVKVPETYIITPDLKLADKIVGSDVDWTSKDIQQKVNTLYRAKSM
jgi:cytochrome oxidase Cu insertion factor (SCO1/SenC/PrrC family)